MANVKLNLNEPEPVDEERLKKRAAAIDKLLKLRSRNRPISDEEIRQARLAVRDGL